MRWADSNIGSDAKDDGDARGVASVDQDAGVDSAVVVASRVVLASAAADLTATHFSFFFPSSLTAVAPSLSDSSSDVTLSSVSASTPVVFSDSELDEEEVSAGTTTASSEADEVAESSVEALSAAFFSAASRRAFLAFTRASFFSSFCE